MSDLKLGQAIQEKAGIQASHNEAIEELFRGIRVHYAKFQTISQQDVEKAQLGLGHAYSHANCQFDINR